MSDERYRFVGEWVELCLKSGLFGTERDSDLAVVVSACMADDVFLKKMYSLAVEHLEYRDKGVSDG